MFQKILLTAALLCAAVSSMPPGLGTARAQGTPVTAAAAAVTTDAEPARVIVKYKADSALLRKTALSATVQPASRAQALGARLGIAMAAGAEIADRTHVVFANGMTSAALAGRLAAESDIEYAVPDLKKRRLAVPNDPFYAARAYNNPSAPTSGGPLVGQWFLKPPGPAGTAANTAPSAIDAERAWDLTTGSASVVVAVVDTGIRFDHVDFRTVADGGNLLPGYDMIADDRTSGDGQAGRDADASDPGDGVTQADINNGVPGCTSGDIGRSSWHGTQTAGLVGAVTDNGVGIASVGRNVRVLPVRVLGKCGGYDSDIIAGMRWAAGLPVSGVPGNPNKASVINLSLGGAGSCSQAYVDAVNEIVAAGTVIVAAAGNTAGRAVSDPANCPGVIGVGALRHVGTKVGFSDVGPQIAISAPGGNCVTIGNIPCQYALITTSNSGSVTPVTGAAGSIYTDAFNTSIGTSFSSPLVAGAVALMRSVQPALTPAELRVKLQSSARPFPATGDSPGVAQCVGPGAVDQLECYCTTSTCGAGMLDARAAVVSAAGVQARIGVVGAAPVALQTVTLSATGSIVPAGRTVTYRWALVDGGGIVNGLTGSTSGLTVSAAPVGPGTFTVSLTATDDQGMTSTATLAVLVEPVPDPTVVVDPAPQAPSSGGGGGGGGGALGAGWLALLAAAVLALAALRRPALSAPSTRPARRRRG